MADSQKSILPLSTCSKAEQNSNEFDFADVIFEKRKHDVNTRKKKPSSSDRSLKLKANGNGRKQPATASSISDTTLTADDSISTGSLSPKSKNLEWQPPLGLDMKTNDNVSKRYLELELNKFKTDLKSMITEVVRGPDCDISDRKRTHAYGHRNKHGGETHAISDSYDSDDDISLLTQRKHKIPRVEDTDTVLNQIDDLLREEEVNTDKGKGESSAYDEEFENTLLNNLQQEYTFEEKTGPQINTKVSDIIGNLFGPISGSSHDETIKCIVEKFPRPSNLKVFSTRVNKEIWNILKPNSRVTDIKLLKTGDKIVHASYAISYLLDDLLKIKNDKTSGHSNSCDLAAVIKKALDALTLLGTSLRDLNQRRRDAMRLDYSFRFSNQLCSAANNAEVGASQLLFGEDLPKKMKELKDIQQMGSKMSNNGYNHNYPKGSSRYSSNKGKAFLWKKTPRRATGYSSNPKSKMTLERKK